MCLIKGLNFKWGTSSVTMSQSCTAYRAGLYCQFQFIRHHVHLKHKCCNYFIHCVRISLRLIHICSPMQACSTAVAHPEAWWQHVFGLLQGRDFPMLPIAVRLAVANTAVCLLSAHCSALLCSSPHCLKCRPRVRTETGLLIGQLGALVGLVELWLVGWVWLCWCGLWRGRGCEWEAVLPVLLVPTQETRGKKNFHRNTWWKMIWWGI